MGHPKLAKEGCQEPSVLEGFLAPIGARYISLSISCALVLT